MAKDEPLCLAFVDLEKAFNRVHYYVIWWTLRKLGTDKWLVKAVQGMYRDFVSKARVNHESSDEFSVQIRIH